MYAQSQIIKKLEAFTSQNGWMPEYHTLAQVEEFKAYINKITRQDANSRTTTITLSESMTKHRADQVRHFIQNEQVLCTIDADYWETRYAYISDNKSNIFKFSNRKSQEVFDSILADFDEKEVAIELLILKARQLGISTKVGLKFLHRLLFLPNTQAVMASNNADKSDLLGRILMTCLKYQPWWLIPRKSTDRIKQMVFDNGSILSVQSGAQPTGIAQGWTPSCVHISEIGDIPNPQKVLEEGLFRATHPTRKLFAVYEGTGNGNTGWQADKWRSAKEDFPKGRSRLCPIFLPWPTAPDQYPENDWIRKFPVPGGWQPHQETRKHVTRCEAYIRNTPYLAKVMGRDWRMPREQQWYWEFNYDEAVKSRTQKVWFSQMPADDFEAMQGKNDKVFDPIVIETRQKERVRDFQDYVITGDTIDEGFEPFEDQIDYTKMRIRVKWTSHRNQKYEWIMVPMKPPAEDTKEKSSLDRMRVYEEPLKGSDYAIGIDTADGLGKEEDDRSVMSITRNEEDDFCDEQVCEFVSNRVNAPQMVGFAACMAAWYGQAETSHITTRDPRGVKFCIEQRTRTGDDCQLQLKFMGFNYHHISTTYDSKAPSETRGWVQGFRTNNVTRPMMTGRFVDAILNGWYKPNSEWLIVELADWERQIAANGKSRFDHQSGKHDDRILAAAMSFFTRHAFDVMADRSTKRFAPQVNKLPPLNTEFARTREVSVGDW